MVRVISSETRLHKDKVIVTCRANVDGRLDVIEVTVPRGEDLQLVVANAMREHGWIPNTK